MNIKIRTKLYLAFFVLIMIPLCLMILIWYRQYSHSLTANIENHTISSIKEANKNFEVTLRDIDYLSTVISFNKSNVLDALSIEANEQTTLESLTSDRKMNDFLSSLYGYKYYISGIQVAGVNGKSYSQGSTLQSSVLIEPTLFQKIEALHGEKLFITTHANTNMQEISPFSSRNVVSIARAIVDGDKTLGVVLVDFGYEVVDKIFSTALGNEGMLFMLDKSDHFVYHPDNQLLNQKLKDTEYAKLGALFTGKEGSFSLPISGKDIFVVYAKSEFTGWTTVGVIPKSVMIEDATKAANQTLIVPILTLLAALLLASFIGHRITRNIRKLQVAMKSVGTGKLDTGVSIHSGDEIEELSHGFNHMMVEIRNLVEDVKLKESQKRTSELKALQAQVNPHFLFNTLNSVRWLAGIQKADNIEQLVTALIELLHVSMGKGDELVTIAQEIEYVRNYIFIQEYRYYDKFQIQFDIEEEILQMKTMKFILQPIVENALIHGIEPLQGTGYITVKGFVSEDKVIFKITDTGVGMSEERLKEIKLEGRSATGKGFSGIGIWNVDERIKLHFGESYGIRIESVLGLFTAVEITIPALVAEED